MITIPANVNVIPASLVGDFHHEVSPIITTVTIPRTLFTNMYVINVKPNGKNNFPVLQSIVSLIIPLTKSTTHSITFCDPVGFIFRLRLANIHPKKVIAVASAIIRTLAKSKVSQDIPKTFSSSGAVSSNSITSFQSFIYKKYIYQTLLLAYCL